MQIIEQGYKAYNGHIFTANEAETYMRACRNTESYARCYGVGSPEHERALNAQHLAFCWCTGSVGV